MHHPACAVRRTGIQFRRRISKGGVRYPRAILLCGAKSMKDHKVEFTGKHQVLMGTRQTRAPQEVPKVRVHYDVTISSVHNVIYRISLYTFLVTFFVSNAPSEVVSMCRRGFYIADVVFSEWHYTSQR